MVFFVITSYAYCQQQKTHSVPSSTLHIKWDGSFGVSKSRPHDIFCLMGNGFFRAPTSSNFNQFISSWLAKHPNAQVVQVEKSGPVMTYDPKSVMIYVWVVDGAENLNEYLVRQGGCPGRTMLIPNTSRYSTNTKAKKGFDQLLVPQQDYVRFMQAVIKAEAKAQEDKLGIWKNGTEID